MYNYPYLSNFLVEPERVDIIRHNGSSYELELYTQCPEDNPGTDIIVMLRLLDPDANMQVQAVGTYWLIDGDIHAQDYWDNPAVSREGFNPLFKEYAGQASRDCGFGNGLKLMEGKPQ